MEFRSLILIFHKILHIIYMIKRELTESLKSMGKIVRRTLDIAMAVLTLILMGGSGLFYNAFGEALDSGLVYEILGAVLFVL